MFNQLIPRSLSPFHVLVSRVRVLTSRFLFASLLTPEKKVASSTSGHLASSPLSSSLRTLGEVLTMADLEACDRMKKPKNNKRKQTIREVNERISKVQRTDSAKRDDEDVKAVGNYGNSELKDSPCEDLEFSSPWKNLQLILCIQNKHLDLQRKVKLAFNFVQSRVEDNDGTDHDYETVKLPRLLSLLNDWIQSLLISSDKKNRSDAEKPQVEGIEAYVDLHCWEIFKFCLQESLRFNLSLNISRNLLRPVHSITRNALAMLEDSSIHTGEYFISCERYKLYDTVVDCVSLVFSSHGGLSNENLESWVSTIVTVLELVQKMYAKNLDGSNMGAFALRFLCTVLLPFSKFLRVHPAKKSGFYHFVDKLLEPLLHLLGELHLQVDQSNPIWTERLLRVVEEVLSHGLFHPVHIDGFLSLQGLEKYVVSCDDKSKDSKKVIKSYHRHLFDEINKIISRKSTMAMGSIGLLFHIFINLARKSKGTSLLSEGTKTVEKTGNFRNLGAGETYSSNNISPDTQKSLFSYFVEIMEPLLVEAKAYLHAKMNVILPLLDLHGILKSVSNLLASFMQEKVYARTEDMSGGACLNFFKSIYDVLMSCSTSLICLSNYDTSNQIEMEKFTLVANEILIAISYLLEIEYEVVGEDSVHLWLIIFSFSAINRSLVGNLDECSVSSGILGLGCQIINLYSQLRQVENAIFPLCKAIRLITSHEGSTEESFSRFVTSQSNEVYSESVESLLSSQKLVHAILKAVQSIPEGQVSRFIKQLTDDVSESLRWIKCTTLAVDLQVELLGRGLSRLYALVLNSVIITEGNSNHLGVAIKELVALMCPYMITLVGQQPDAVGRFLASVMGKTVNDRTTSKKKVLKKFGRSSQWVLVFFFQLFMCCRSLHRQAISLMSPGLSKKMSAEAGDSFTAYSACELMERIDEIHMGFFSWVIQPSASLLDVMQFISDIYLEDSSADCCYLIYIFNSMALQRLNDLNRQIVLFRYLQNNHYKSRIKSLKEEAAGLSNFMMKNLSCVYQSPIFIYDCVTSENSSQAIHQRSELDLGVYVANRKSLPTAIWSILCKNIDIWGNHAAKKQFKKFLSHLLYTSLQCVVSNFPEVEVDKMDECKLNSGVTLPYISSELLSSSILYEQRCVCRNLASSFCHILEKSVIPVFSNTACTDISLQASPKWLEFFSALDSSPMVANGNKDASVDCSAVQKSITHSCNKLPSDISREEKASPFTSKSFRICYHLLNLLCQMPDVNGRSFSRYTNYIFNLERLLVTTLVQFQETPCTDYCEFLRLFVSCRKALRYIIMGCFEKAEVDKSLPNVILYESSFPVLWLFKSVSVIVGLKDAFSANNAVLVKSMIFSLMDHTSYALLGIGKYHITHVLSSVKEAEKPCEDISNTKFDHKGNQILQSAQHVDSPKFESWKVLSTMSAHLKEKMQSLLVPLKACSRNLGFGIANENMNMLSFTISCFSRFLWGVASVMKLKEAEGSDCEEKVAMWKSEQTSELNACVHTLLEFMEFFTRKLVLENNQTSSTFTSVVEPGSETSIAGVLNMADSFEAQSLNKNLLQSLLKGEHPEATFLLTQLLIAFSALLRINLQKGSSSTLSSFVPTFTEISQVLLLEFTEMTEVPQQYAFLLLDGVLSYLRELANYFPLTDPTSSRKLYAKLIGVYLRALGKTISLQGKRATLDIHERQSSTKTLYNGSGEANSFGLYSISLDKFKARLRMSFKAYIEKPSELHLLSTIQAIERAVVGVHERCTMIYDIERSTDGGRISSLVAAGIDCFDVVLEFVSGRKALKLIKRHIQSLFATVLNIILHLQSPQIFYGDLNPRTIVNDPDPGSVILMCVEVLVTVSRKHSLFQMDVWHAGHLLHVPAALFQNFHQLRTSNASRSSESFISEDEISHPIETMKFCHVDRLFSVHLFVACCQLLCTIIKYHPSECKQCIAHLEASVAVLLYCLETVDTESVLNKGSFSWEVEEGVKCACFLRRVYEEIKQQKDIFSRQCSLFLSKYIWVYSGYGPKRSGIKREIDEALRPGVYALIDACSVDDLQYLHTVFGEGPCRNTLATLQHDYKLNFKYEGKV
ncbi:hypothetical protein L6164_037592 [Bauhinia variegata]|uniref:Uncharacterized protein n=1 Tax=Bauhinia variegata TaxID=167791 RepID=A0ACB9KL83_BAUVA|nr:hypothetical protein L6164_037592 [Bauhinia variegata]